MPPARCQEVAVHDDLLTDEVALVASLYSRRWPIQDSDETNRMSALSTTSNGSRLRSARQSATAPSVAAMIMTASC